MSKIRSKDTKPELIVRKFLFANGYRYRLHDPKLPGKPDIVLKKYKTAIFVHGCFWHNHLGCKYAVIPKTRTDWWMQKISKNQDNDAKAVSSLINLGWKVIILWECQLKPKSHIETLNSLIQGLEG